MTSTNQQNQASQDQAGSQDILTEANRVSRRTPMACQFCRGRKLKCDGRQTCANCARRGIPCVYVPISASSSSPS
ncbi:hypothetical protein SCP_1402320 [Sparassis crispa]|uniref:Zn(2)-C6 fungal-type domain-containing protein n=1 Tax=Sparassis crispa TaxID=139825 RepID=A0A401H304_9APHY|nr:hypothetical protein SCP_1402320 [Sparassis crispa]GBE88825.1 hypothetical protein SCP_1402320 [Sparassis crispa]